MALTIKPSPKIQKKTTEHVKILTFDIERIPGRAKVQHRGLSIEGEFWDLGGWKHTIGRRIHADDVVSWPRTICAAGRWYGQKEVMFAAEWEEGGHEAFMRTMWAWFDQATVIVGHNSVGFDEKHARSGFLEYGWTPPSPWKSIDTLRVARNQLNFESNTLDALAKRLGVASKTDKYSADIAHAAIAGDEKAQKKLKRYNEGDIKATEAVFDRLRPYIKNGPHLGMWTGGAWSCPNCGFDGIANNPTGEAYANVTRYKAFQCEKCGTHIRGNKKLQDPTHTRIYR